MAERVGIQRGWKEEGGGSEAASHTEGGGGRYRYGSFINQKRMRYSMDELFRCFTLNQSMDPWTIYVFHIEPFNG